MKCSHVPALSKEQPFVLTLNKAKYGARRAIAKTVDESTALNLPPLEQDTKVFSSKQVEAPLILKRWRLKPLCVKAKSEGDKKTANTLILEMKERAILGSTKSIMSTASTSSDVSYLFVSDKRSRSDKESKLQSFLDTTGIFQIHLSAALEEFSPWGMFK